MIRIPWYMKYLVHSCMDCHATFGKAGYYPCIEHKVCPLNVPGELKYAGNGKRKLVRACLVVGKDCGCV